MVAYMAFRYQVYSPRHVLHGCCAKDNSAAIAFGRDKVTFVDTDDRAMQELRADGCRALTEDMARYRPNQLHDVVVVINSSGMDRWHARHLKPGGFFLVNNYHGAAEELYANPRIYEMWGSISVKREGDGMTAVVSRDVSNLLVPVQSFAELMQLDPERSNVEDRINRGFIGGSYEGAMPETPEERHLLRCRLKGDPERLPYRADPQVYIFTKRPTLENEVRSFFRR